MQWDKWKFWEHFKNLKVFLRDLFYQHRKQQVGYPLAWMIVTMGGSFLVISLFFLSLLFLFVGSEYVILVPDVRKLSLEEALYQLQERNLNTHLISQFSQYHDDKGKVIGQSPAPGKPVKRGRAVRLTLSKGAFSQKVGDYLGLDLQMIRASFSEKKQQQQELFLYFRNESVVYKTDESPAGTILEQNPAPGQFINVNMPLFLVVSSGPRLEFVELGEYVGQPIELVFDDIYRKKLHLYLSFVQESDIDASQLLIQDFEVLDIVKQSHEPGVSVHPGTELELSFLLFPESPNYEIFSYDLPNIPLLIPTELMFIRENQESTVLYEGVSWGQRFQFPYSIEQKGTLVLSLFGEVVYKKELEDTTIVRGSDV